MKPQSPPRLPAGARLWCTTQCAMDEGAPPRLCQLVRYLDNKKAEIILEEPGNTNHPTGGTTLVCSVDSLVRADPHFDVADNVELQYLTYPNVLENLCVRFARARDNDKFIFAERAKIYTFTGWILLCLNPFDENSTQKLYSERVCEQYFKRPLGSEPPHPFATASSAHEQLVREKVPQFILVTGESGSGKTECSKHLLKYLTWVTWRMRRWQNRCSIEGKASDAAERLSSLLIAANPILEFFGNAKTIKNANSSRFGKLLRVNYSHNGERLVSAQLDTYLLAKSRVVSVPDREENYHVFYAILNNDYSLFHEPNQQPNQQPLNHQQPYPQANNDQTSRYSTTDDSTITGDTITATPHPTTNCHMSSTSATATAIDADGTSDNCNKNGNTLSSLGLSSSLAPSSQAPPSYFTASSLEVAMNQDHLDGHDQPENRHFVSNPCVSHFDTEMPAARSQGPDWNSGVDKTTWLSRMLFGEDVALFTSRFLGNEPTGYYGRRNHDFHISRLVRAFLEFDISVEHQLKIYRILAGVLYLGQVEFVKTDNSRSLTPRAGGGSRSGGSGACAKRSLYDAHILDREPLDRAMTLWDLKDPDASNKLLMQLTSSPVRDTTRMLDSVEATAMLNSFCKGVYELVFQYVVSLIRDKLERNKYQAATAVVASLTHTQTGPEAEHLPPCVGVLDLFGFENMKNGFEQLCINYANEELQRHFVEQVIANELNEYKREGIIENVDRFTEQVSSLPSALALFHGSEGLFAILEDACSLKQSDIRFCARVNELLQKSGTKRRKLPQEEHSFVVHHYAEPVCYSADGFIERNTDYLSSGLKTFLHTHSSPENSVLSILRSILTGGGGGGGVSGGGSGGGGLNGGVASINSRSGRTATISQVFQKQMQGLIRESLGPPTNCYFIKCLKPNESQQSYHIDRSLVLRQLVTGGIGPVLDVMSLGFPCRVHSAKLLERFGGYLPAKLSKISPHEFVEVVLSVLKIPPDSYKFGSERVFFRFDVYRQIELRFTQVFRSEFEKENFVAEIVRARNRWWLHKAFCAAIAAVLIRQKNQFIREGRGRKLICVWVCVWARRREEKAALVLQNWHLDVGMIRIWHRQRIRSLRFIQIWIRDELFIRKLEKYLRLFEINRCGRVVAAVCRAYTLKVKKAQTHTLLQNSAATTIQAWVRGRLIRAQYQRLTYRVQSHAARRIQRLFRLFRALPREERRNVIQHAWALGGTGGVRTGGVHPRAPTTPSARRMGEAIGYWEMKTGQITPSEHARCGRSIFAHTSSRVPPSRHAFESALRTAPQRPRVSAINNPPAHTPLRQARKTMINIGAGGSSTSNLVSMRTNQFENLKPQTTTTHAAAVSRQIISRDVVSRQLSREPRTGGGGGAQTEEFTRSGRAAGGQRAPQEGVSNTTQAGRAFSQDGRWRSAKRPPTPTEGSGGLAAKIGLADVPRRLSIAMPSNIPQTADASSNSWDTPFVGNHRFPQEEDSATFSSQTSSAQLLQHDDPVAPQGGLRTSVDPLLSLVSRGRVDSVDLVHSTTGRRRPPPPRESTRSGVDPAQERRAAYLGGGAASGLCAAESKRGSLVSQASPAFGFDKHTSDSSSVEDGFETAREIPVPAPAIRPVSSSSASSPTEAKRCENPNSQISRRSLLNETPNPAPPQTKQRLGRRGGFGQGYKEHKNCQACQAKQNHTAHRSPRPPPLGLTATRGKSPPCTPSAQLFHDTNPNAKTKTNTNTNPNTNPNTNKYTNANTNRADDNTSASFSVRAADSLLLSTRVCHAAHSPPPLGGRGDLGLTAVKSPPPPPQVTGDEAVSDESEDAKPGRASISAWLHDSPGTAKQQADSLTPLFGQCNAGKPPPPPNSLVGFALGRNHEPSHDNAVLARGTLNLSAALADLGPDIPIPPNRTTHNYGNHNNATTTTTTTNSGTKRNVLRIAKDENGILRLVP